MLQKCYHDTLAQNFQETKSQIYTKTLLNT